MAVRHRLAREGAARTGDAGAGQTRAGDTAPGGAQAVGAAAPVPEMDRTTYVVAIAAFALLMCSFWSVKNGASAIPDFVRFTSRILKGVIVIGMALAFRNRPPRPLAAFGVGAVCMAAHLACYAAFYLLDLDSGTYIVLGLMSGVFASVGEGVAMVLMLQLVSTFPVRWSAIGIVAALLANEALFLAALSAPTPALLVMRPAAKAAATCLLGWCVLRKRRLPEGSQERRMEAPAAGGALARDAVAALALIVGVKLFAITVFNVTEQVAYIDHAGTSVYDVPNELAAVGALALMLLYLVARRGMYSFEAVVIAAVLLSATGCLLVIVQWRADFLLGVTLVKCMNAMVMLTTYAEIARGCYRSPAHAWLYAGLPYGSGVLLTALLDMGLSAAVPQMGRGEGLAVSMESGLAWFVTVAATGFMATALYGRGARSERVARPGQGLGEGLGEGALDRVRAAYGLSTREEQVLLETARGLGMAEAGERLGISQETVKSHLRHIYQKVGVSDKQELLAFVADELAERPAGGPLIK